MIDITGMSEPCPACANIKSYVYHLNAALRDTDGRISKVSLIGSNFEHEAIELSGLEVKCSRCEGRGEVLTEQGQRVVRMLASWLPKGGA